MITFQRIKSRALETKWMVWGSRRHGVTRRATKGVCRAFCDSFFPISFVFFFLIFGETTEYPALALASAAATSTSLVYSRAAFCTFLFVLGCVALRLCWLTLDWDDCRNGRLALMGVLDQPWAFLAWYGSWNYVKNHWQMYSFQC